MGDRPRVLVIGDDAPEWLAGREDIVLVRNLGDAVSHLRKGTFQGVYVSSQHQEVLSHTLDSWQQVAILEVLGEGIAVLHPDLRVVWANATFEKWCGQGTGGRNILDVLPLAQDSDQHPFELSLLGKPSVSRVQLSEQRSLDLRIQPVLDSVGNVQQIFTLWRDVSAEVIQQRKIDAIYKAGQEFAVLTTDQLADTPVHERIEMLKHNIRKLTHNLLHYDVIEIRTLDPRTGELKPLLAEGMTPEAACRVLHAKVQDNGVTGYVAAKGETYVCQDASCDPHYLQGAKGARSSLTIPLKQRDQVIGTFNVESPQLSAFSQEDVQFAEIFCRELAQSLYTLDLLLVEKQTTANQSIDAINREVGLPVDEILNAATSILDRYIGHDAEMGDKLRKIIDNARVIRDSIRKVGEEIAQTAQSFTLTEAPTAPLNMRVLVVDHDRRVRQSAHSVLGRLGCVVETAQAGCEALTMAKLSKYDAILTDIRLPDVNGYEMYKSLRKAQPSAHVIFMTGFGYDLQHSIVKAKQDGLKHVLFKPFRVEQLLKALCNPPESLS